MKPYSGSGLGSPLQPLVGSQSKLESDLSNIPTDPALLETFKMKLPFLLRSILTGNVIRTCCGNLVIERQGPGLFLNKAAVEELILQLEMK